MKFILFLFILLNLQISQAWKIESIKGSVTLKDGSTSSVVSAGTEVMPGQIVMTGPSSRALLVENKSRMWVGANTSFVINSLSASANRQVVLKLGKVRVQLDKPEAKIYNFKVPTAVVGVRGTEFFLSVAGKEENICVLEGVVEAKVGDKDLLVYQNYGAQIMYGGQPEVLINDPLVVKRWVAETSFDEQFIENYSQLSRPLKKHQDFKYSSQFSYNYCQTTGSVDKDCHRARLESEWVYQDKITITPLVNYVHTKDDSTIDTSPVYIGQQYSQLTLKELSYKYKNEKLKVRTGIFPRAWNDGLFLSSINYGNEHLSLVGGELAYTQQNNFSIEGLFNKGISGGQPLQGFIPWNFAGVRFLWPKINIFHLDFALEEAHFGYTGIYFSEAIRQLSFSGQFVNQSGDELSSFTELKVGYDFNYQVPFKIGAATQKFDKNFTSPIAENYIFGASQLLSLNNNNQVDRVSFDFNVTENHIFGVEYLSNKELETGDLLGYESDVSYSYNSEMSWNFKTIFWSLKQPSVKKTQGIHFWFNYGF